MTDSIESPHEASIWIAVNGTRRYVLSCSPHGLDAVATGHLLTTGYIRHARDILDLAVIDGPGGARGVNVTVEDAPADAAVALERHRTEFGCGLRHELDCAPGTLRIGPRSSAPTGIELHVLFRRVFAFAEQIAPSGGLHACALVGERDIAFIDSDVARHCAVDRVIGLAAQEGADFGALGLVLSARLSGAMALKAAVAGIGWIASRSVATSLATEIVGAAGIPVLERAARRSES